MRREGLWLWALAALVLLAIVIVLGVRACDDDKGTSSTGTPVITEPPSTVPTTTPSLTDSVPETTPGGPEPDPPTLPPGSGGGTLVVGTRISTPPSQAASRNSRTSRPPARS